MKKQILAFMLAGCFIFLAACQPTPEKPIVESKNDGELEEAVYGTPVPELSEPYDAPETLVLDTIPGTDDITFFNVNATVTVPDVLKYPVYRVGTKETTAEDAKTFITTFIGEDPLYTFKNPRTKKVIEREIAEEQYQLNDPDSDFNQDYKSGNLSEELYEHDCKQFEDRIKELQAEYKTAPDDFEFEEVTDYELKPQQMGAANYLKGVHLHSDKTAGYASVTCDKTEPYGYDQIKIYRSQYDLEKYEWRQGDIIPPDIGTMGWTDKQENLINMTLSYDEAKTMADDIVYNKLKYSDLSLERVCSDPVFATYTDRVNGYERYVFIYTKTVDGIPMQFYTMDDIERYEDYGKRIYPPCVCVFVKDKDNFEVQERASLTMLDKLNDNAKLLPFDQIVNIFKEQIALHVDTNDYVLSSEENLESVNYNITDIRLGYVRILEKNNIAQGLLVPVWCFYGLQVNKYTDDNKKDNGFALNDNNEKVFDRAAGNAFLCINALDGTIVNLDVGY